MEYLVYVDGSSAHEDVDEFEVLEDKPEKELKQVLDKKPKALPPIVIHYPECQKGGYHIG